jgi:hypothetical protein
MANEQRHDWHRVGFNGGLRASPRVQCAKCVKYKGATLRGTVATGACVPVRKAIRRERYEGPEASSAGGVSHAAGESKAPITVPASAPARETKLREDVRRMWDANFGVNPIAERFGVSHRTARRLLAPAKLHPWQRRAEQNDRRKARRAVDALFAA